MLLHNLTKFIFQQLYVILVSEEGYDYKSSFCQKQFTLWCYKRYIFSIFWDNVQLLTVRYTFLHIVFNVCTFSFHITKTCKITRVFFLFVRKANNTLETLFRNTYHYTSYCRKALICKLCNKHFISILTFGLICILWILPILTW